jgi:hypothetical protein
MTHMGLWCSLGSFEALGKGHTRLFTPQSLTEAGGSSLPMEHSAFAMLQPLKPPA